MIDPKTITELAKRHQTARENIVQEYFQHLFLSRLYQQKKAERFLFKGGTALRVIWQSPRFSEDLDFTGNKITIPEIESVLEGALLRVEEEGLGVDIEEAKKTSGGYLAILQFAAAAIRACVQVEVSLRSSAKISGETSLVASDFLPPFTLIHLDKKILVREKINACLTRAKPRDFFDLYFILRSRLAFSDVFSKDKILKIKILSAIKGADLNLKSELKRFLPSSHHGLLKNFKKILEAEVARSFPG